MDPPVDPEQASRRNRPRRCDLEPHPRPSLPPPPPLPPLTQLETQVSNLVLAYTTLLTSLLSSPLPSLYVFAETGEHTWLSIGEAIHAALSRRGLVEGPLAFTETKSYIGSNSRSKAEVLRELGWKPEERESVWQSVESELEEILKEERSEWARLGERK